MNQPAGLTPGASNADRMRFVIEELQVKGRVELIEEFFHPEAVDHPDPRSSVPLTYTDIADTTRLFLENFEGFAVEIVRITGEGDFVATYKIFRGRHVGGEFLGIAATGRDIWFPVFDLVRFEDGRIAEHWAVADTGEFLRQTGVVPA